ncbi:SH2B2-like protein [Mya arenaria]|uniref:SH2B2-like protein n=1 Tax=Mya arenaria TaxID=6604 RepID=A0ABY7FM91_MYAAR|nr:SH2B2-like protein [Mya arenaria]
MYEFRKSDEHSMDVMLLRNPWFHGTLGRREAEKLVLKQSHGVFLIRRNHNTIELMLLEQPWFHATLSRLEAEQLVLPQSHGVFLIRRSNTRKGEYVLTVNFHDKAMHLRVTINNEGRCETELQWFNSVLDMIQHFYHNPIPMVHGTFDMTLTTYVDYRT